MFGMDDDTMPDERGSASETPYMRRSRAVAVQRSRFSLGIRRVAWWAGIVIFVLLPVGAGGYSLAVYLLNSPRFRLTSSKDVKVLGNHYVTREQVLDTLGVGSEDSRRDQDIFRLSLKRAREQVESIPWILSATVVRSYPHALAVYVTERRPVAFVDVGGQVKMVDAHGVLLNTPDKSHFDFPIIEGLDFQADAEGRQEQINLYQEFMRETRGKVSRSGWTVSEVNLTDVSNLKALLVQGERTLLVYFGHTDFRARFENLLEVLPQLRKTNAGIGSVDLRFRNQVVVNPAGQNPGDSQAPESTTGKTKGT